MTDKDKLEYQIQQLAFEKKNLQTQLRAAMNLAKKNFEKIKELEELVKELRNRCTS